MEGTAGKSVTTEVDHPDIVTIFCEEKARTLVSVIVDPLDTWHEDSMYKEDNGRRRCWEGGSGDSMEGKVDIVFSDDCVFLEVEAMERNVGILRLNKEWHFNTPTFSSCRRAGKACSEMYLPVNQRSRANNSFVFKYMDWLIDFVAWHVATLF